MPRIKVGRSRALWRPALALLACVAAWLPMGLAAQEMRSGSALAGVEWPLSAYDWADDPDGPRQTLLEDSASALGRYCGAAREFYAWNLEGHDDPDAVRLSVLNGYEAAGWALTQPVTPDPALNLAVRGETQLVVRLYPIPERQALALFSCALQAEPVTAAAVAESAFADRAARSRQTELPVLAGFGWAALAVALGCMLLELRTRRRVRAAAGWAEVPAVIVESSIKKTTRTSANDDEYTSYTPVIRYRYRYAEAEYESKRLRFGSSDTAEREEAEVVIAPYQPGAAVTARVNPAKPSEATLLIEPARLLRALLPTIVFGVIGVVLLVVVSAL